MHGATTSHRPTQDLADILACPGCKAPVRVETERVRCNNDGCGATFPIVDERPLMIWEARSLFDIDRVANSGDPLHRGGFKSWTDRYLPNLDGNFTRDRNYDRFCTMLLEESESPRVLSVEISRRCDGLEHLRHRFGLRLTTINLTLGPHVDLVADSHDLPFLDSSLDGAVAHAVVDHVIDVQRTMSEIHRVLKPRGLIYVEAPFMQPVHLGRHDFLRFSLLGVRRLMRDYELIEQGVGCGPGMALGLAYASFLQSFFTGEIPRRLAFLFARLSGFWFKYFDRYLSRTPAGIDSMAGSYFLGRRSDRRMADREIAACYVGGQAGHPFAAAGPDPK